MLPRVAYNWGPCYPLYLVTKYWFSQNSPRTAHSFGPAPYPYRVCRRRPLFNVSWDFLRYSNNRNKGSWYMIAISWTILISMRANPVPQRLRKPCKTSWNCTAVLTQVSMTASKNFYRTLSRLITQVYAFNFMSNTKIVYLGYVGRVMYYHMFCTSINSFSHRDRLGGVVSLSR